MPAWIGVREWGGGKKLDSMIRDAQKGLMGIRRIKLCGLKYGGG